MPNWWLLGAHCGQRCVCFSSGPAGRGHSQTRRPQGLLQGPLWTEDTLSSAGQRSQHATQPGGRHPGPGPQLNLLRPPSRKAGNSHACAFPLGNKRANPDLLPREGRAPPMPVHFLLSRARRWLRLPRALSPADTGRAAPAPVSQRQANMSQCVALKEAAAAELGWV